MIMYLSKVLLSRFCQVHDILVNIFVLLLFLVVLFVLFGCFCAAADVNFIFRCGQVEWLHRTILAWTPWQRHCRARKKDSQRENNQTNVTNDHDDEKLVITERERLRKSWIHACKMTQGTIKVLREREREIRKDEGKSAMSYKTNKFELRNIEWSCIWNSVTNIYVSKKVEKIK